MLIQDAIRLAAPPGQNLYEGYVFPSPKKPGHPIEARAFDQAVEAIQKRYGGSRCGAMSRAADEYPDLLAKREQQGLERAEKALGEPYRKVEALVQFRKRIDQIAAAEGCSRTQAMERARTRYPQEFDAYWRA